VPLASDGKTEDLEPWQLRLNDDSTLMPRSNGAVHRFAASKEHQIVIHLMNFDRNRP
jgi:hypothetical protein